MYFYKKFSPFAYIYISIQMNLLKKECTPFWKLSHNHITEHDYESRKGNENIIKYFHSSILMIALATTERL